MTRRRVKRWAGIPLADLCERWKREDVYLYGDIDSTMSAARALADDGAPSGTIVLSRGQTGGRGRGGATFHSPSGDGVYLSMVFRAEGEEIDAPITILAGLGIATELERRFTELRPSVKWPNDLIARDRKLGGILAEATRDPVGAHQLIVGVGINLSTDRLPEDLAGHVVGMDTCCEAEAVDVADAIVAGLERWLYDPPRALNEDMLTHLDRLDWLKNRRIAINDSSEGSVAGWAAGIAPDGGLLFRPDRGALRAVTMGSVEVLEETP